MLKFNQSILYRKISSSSISIVKNLQSYFSVIHIDIIAKNDNKSKITFTQPFDNRTLMAPVLAEQRNKKLLTWTNCIIYLTAFPLICLCLGTCFFKDNSEEMNKFRIVYFSSWCVVQIPACRSSFHKKRRLKILWSVHLLLC